MFPTIEEEEEEDDLFATAPPEFADSPSTPRSNPRYHFRPSPSRPTHTDPFNPAEIQASLERAFEEADESLFGPRSSRSRQQRPLPDDVLHRYPQERGKRPRK